MSRIEIAMERAARLRQGKVTEDRAVVDLPEPVPKPARVERPVPASDQRLSSRHPFLVNFHDPHSPTAEEYRKLKVKVTNGEIFRNTIVVTSSIPNEGKSLTALNLAISLAQELDHTVLLVDADLRRPSLHRYLDVEPGAGLADVLLGEAEMTQTIVATGIAGLSVIRAGREVDNPAELFLSQRMKELLEEMKERYRDRYVIFDTCPVLPFAETRSLANLVDGVLFVVMERLVPRESVVDALELLKGCQLLGLIYNAAELSGNDERYSSYKNYS